MNLLKLSLLAAVILLMQTTASSQEKTAVKKETSGFIGSVYLGYGYGELVNPTNNGYSSRYKTGPYLKLGLIVREKPLSVLSSFVDVSINIGFSDSKDVYYSNILMGQRMELNFNKKGNLSLFAEIGAGASYVSTPFLNDSELGVAGIIRMGLRYDNWFISYETNPILTRNYSLVTQSINFGYSF